MLSTIGYLVIYVVSILVAAWFLSDAIKDFTKKRIFSGSLHTVLFLAELLAMASIIF